MVRDLNLPLEIMGVPTVREADGLALSSRNAYLSADERRIAPLLYKAITDVARGTDPAEVSQRLLSVGFTKIDYITVRDASTLAPYDTKSGHPGRVLAAVWLGKTRLIDNVAVGLTHRDYLFAFFAQALLRCARGPAFCRPSY